MNLGLFCMKKPFYLLLGLLFLGGKLIAQDVVLKGTALNAAGKQLRIYQYNELVTRKLDKIAVVNIDSLNRFSIKLEVWFTREIILAIGFNRGSLIIEPGKKYEILIDSIDYQGKEQPISWINSEPLNIRLLNTNITEVNQQLAVLDSLNSALLLKYYKILNRPGNKFLVDTFTTWCKKAFPAPGEWIQTAIEYRTAYLEISAKIFRTESILYRYFSEKPILYNHREYMYCLSEAFTNYLLARSKAISSRSLIYVINNRLGLKALLDTIQKDTLFRNRQLAELVFLTNVSAFYKDPLIVPQAMDDMLNEIATQGRYALNKQIAYNLLKAPRQLSSGDKAPAFFLKEITGDSLNLNTLRGKFIYLNFFTTQCKICLAEFSLLEELNRKYNRYLEIVSISLDNMPLRLEYFLKGKKYYWKFAWFGFDMDMMDAYNVISIPKYILIDTQGNIIANPALPPSQGFENYFKTLIKGK